jgi:hypothetical protein
MQKISFKNWLIYLESAYTAGTAALAFTPSSDLRKQSEKTQDMVKPSKAQKVRQLHNIVSQIQKVLPNKIQLFKNNLNNKMVHPIEPFSELAQTNEMQNIKSFQDLDNFLEKSQNVISTIEKAHLEKFNDQQFVAIQDLINKIQQIISLTEKTETDDEKKKIRDLRVIKMIDSEIVTIINTVEQIIGDSHAF